MVHLIAFDEIEWTMVDPSRDHSIVKKNKILVTLIIVKYEFG